MYATGDDARWLPDGTIEFLGRRDNQVKVRGFRIELGEIESTLGAFPAVRECVVIVREDVPGDKRIVAYVVPTDLAGTNGDELKVSDLRAAAGKKLPGYMIPAHFVTMEALPLSPNGKVDRARLPSPDPSQEVEAPYQAPGNEVERKIAEIWQQVLGVERVGVRDNFFELGGNSLLSTQTMSRVRAAFDVDLPLRRLFEDPTVAGLAARVGTNEVAELAGRDYAEVFDQCMIPLQPNGWKKPLFVVSGAHAHEDDFLRFVGALLPHMGSDQPIYGFKARGLDGVSPPHTSAEDMASDYVRELRTLFPEGPYLLMGNCVGGIVAFEMARQLREAGQEVALLALMDTTAPIEGYRDFVQDYYRFWKKERFTEHLENMRDLSLPDKVGYVLERIGRKARRLLPLSDEARRTNHIEDVERNYSQVLARYQPRPCEDFLTLILNEELHEEVPEGGWTPWVAGGMELHVVSGDHVTRLTMNAAESAEILEQCIARGLARGEARVAAS